MKQDLVTDIEETLAAVRWRLEFMPADDGYAIGDEVYQAEDLLDPEIWAKVEETFYAVADAPGDGYRRLEELWQTFI